MVELEFINDFRDYKLNIKYKSNCECGSTLNLHMINGSVNQICNDNHCRKQYDIRRQCSKCKLEYYFEDIVCDKCEPEVIRQAELHMTIINSEKALKKLKRDLKEYPLLPYIDYWSISKNISRLPCMIPLTES